MAATVDAVRIRLLGSVELEAAGADLGGSKPRQALALLAARPGEVVPTGTLIDLLWPEAPPADPHRSLQVHVSNLRRAIETAALDAAIDHHQGGYVLRVDPEVVDVRCFEALVDRGMGLVADDPDAARDVLGRALDLWRGAPFGRAGDHPVLRGEVSRLEDLRLRALEARVDAELATGRHQDVVGELSRLVDEHPLRERLTAQLMVALYRSGRQADALETYEAARRMLADELGVDPSAALRELHTRVLRQDPELEAVPERAPAGRDEPRSQEGRSVAVLPFDVFGGADDAAYLAMGLHSDLLTELSKVPELTVISRTSVLSYRGTDKPIPVIARELGAGTVVEGSVQSAGDRFRLTVQLVDGRDDVQRWAESYDRQLTTEDLFAIQSDLARDIVRSLHAELLPARDRGGREGPATDSLEAYGLAARGRQQFDLKTEDGFRRAIELYGEAVAIDPEYADAWLGLSDALASMEAYGHGEAHELLPRAERALGRALELDPDSAGAHTSLGVLHASVQDGPAAIAEFERAIRIQPSYADAHNWHSWLSLILGRAGPGLDSALRASELDPVSAEALAHIALGHAANGRPEEGVAAARRACRFSPYTTAEFYEGICLHDLGRFDEACDVLEPLTVARRGEPGVPWAGRGPDAVFALALAGRGDLAGARVLLHDIEAEAHPFAAGLIHLALGETEAAVRSFETVDLLSDWPCLAVHHYHRGVWERLGSSDSHSVLVRRALASWQGDLGPSDSAPGR